MLAAVGFGLLVLTIGSIDQRMTLPQREQRADASEPDSTARSSALDAPSNEARGTEAEDGEAISPSDSTEERIRKKYGMVLVAGVWLPATPIKGIASASGAAGASPDDEAAPKFSVPLYITTGRLREGKVGERYQSRIEAVGGVPPYAWSLEKGGAAESITLHRATGELSGTPSELVSTTVRVRVTDAVGAADIAEYKLRVVASVAGLGAADPVQGAAATALAASKTTQETSAEALDPDSADGPPDDSDPATTTDSTAAPLAISPSPLADAKVAERYTAAFGGTGGTPPYAWSSLGPLPAGLTLTPGGILSGTPQTPGDFTLSIAVTDQAAQTAALGFALKVTPGTPAAVTRFTAFVSLRKVAFTWANPADPALASIRIVRNSANPPSSEQDGLIVFEGQAQSAVDAAPPPGGSYYAAFAITADGIASAPATLAVTLNTSAEPFADAVANRSLLHAQAFNASLLPSIVLGSPRGGGIGSGSTDVVSLGAASVDEAGTAPYGGSLVISFDNNLAYDGPGADFTIFENVFYIRGATGYDPNSRMMEPAIVSVSQDGVTWHTFPFDFSPRYDATTGALNLRHPFVYNKGFAGVNPVIASGYNVDPTDPTVSGGDSFDLADLHIPGLDWIRYVRLQSTGDKWLADSDGELVRHSNTTAFKEATRSSASSGFDLDAVTAIWLDAVR